jgi:AcrR family transcriptional regulator
VEERREELLELALEQFSTRAYDEVSLEDFAAAAGVSKGLVYHYFPGKRELYIATLRLASERLLARTEPDATLPKPLRMHQGLAAYLDYVEGYAKSYTALLKGGIGFDAEAAAIVDGCRQVVMERVLSAIGVDAARVPPALRQALRGWVGFAEATSIDWLEHRSPPKEQVLTLLVTMIGNALAAAQALDPDIRLDLEG